MAKSKIVKLSQNPLKNAHNFYEDKSLGLYVGVSNTSNVTEPTSPHTFDEFITIIEGTAEIKNNNTGKLKTVTAGESFVIPKGCDYQWHQSSDLRMFNVIYTPLTNSKDQGEPEDSTHQDIIYFDEHNIKSASTIPWQATSDGHKKKVIYQNPSHTFTSGIWQSEGFNTGFITFQYNEFFIVKQGNLTCTDDASIEHKVSSGEALFIPKDAHCSWLATEELTLYFVQIKQL